MGRRGWVIAGVVLGVVVLGAVAYGALRGPGMELSPERAAPGDDVTLRFPEPRDPGELVTLEHDGATYVLQGGQLTDLPEGDPTVVFSLQSGAPARERTITLPQDLAEGGWELCLLGDADRPCADLTVGR